MSPKDYAAWLYVPGISREKWAMSPGTSIVRSYKGTVVDDFDLPGLLFGFSSAKAAAKTAMRFHFDLANMFEKELPAMVVDSGGNPKLLPVIVYGGSPRTVIVTPEAARNLAGEPVELKPGPEIKVEGGTKLSTKFLPPSEHNIGWALPTVQVQVTGAYPDKGGPSFPSGGSEGPEEESIVPSRRVKWAHVGQVLKPLFALALFAFSAFFVQKRLFPVVEETTLAAPTPAPKAESLVVERDLLLIPPRPTAVPLGYGAVVIQVDPRDARIFVDDILVAKKSPVTLQDRSNRDVYKLVVKRKGYKTYTKIFNVEADRRLVLNVMMEKGRDEK